MPLKFLDAGGSGSDLAAAAAVRYAADHGARVSNNSYGGAAAVPPWRRDRLRREQGRMIFVAAAGNSAREHRRGAELPIGYTEANIIAVAAIDSNGNRSRASRITVPGALTSPRRASGFTARCGITATARCPARRWPPRW